MTSLSPTPPHPPSHQHRGAICVCVCVYFRLGCCLSFLSFTVCVCVSDHGIYLGWLVDVFGQERQLAKLAVVDATVELLIQQPEMLVWTTDNPRFAVAGDLQGHEWHFRFNWGRHHLASLFVKLNLQFPKQTNKQTKRKTNKNSVFIYNRFSIHVPYWPTQEKEDTVSEDWRPVPSRLPVVNEPQTKHTQQELKRTVNGPRSTTS